jgi:hypothetical protein
VFDVEIDDEVPMGNNHGLYLRVLKDGASTDCVIESDVPAHPYQVMGVGSRRDWRTSLTLDEARHGAAIMFRSAQRFQKLSHRTRTAHRGW